MDWALTNLGQNFVQPLASYMILGMLPTTMEPQFSLLQNEVYNNISLRS